MTQQQQANGSQRDHHPPSESNHDRKQRVLTKRTPSIVRGIADAIVIKDEDLFLLTKPDGCVPLEGPHGHGLYFHDCRFLNGYELKLADTKPDVLAATALTGYASIFQLTNPDIYMADGILIEKEHIGIKLERTIDSGKQSLYDLI